MRTVPLTAVPGCVDERQPRGRRPLARRCRAAEAGRSGGDDCSRWGRPTTLRSLSFRFTSPTTRFPAICLATETPMSWGPDQPTDGRTGPTVHRPTAAQAGNSRTHHDPVVAALGFLAVDASPRRQTRRARPPTIFC